MDYGIWIFRDDEFDAPLYAAPTREELEDEPLWQQVCENVLEAVDNDGPRFETSDFGSWRIGWKLHARTGVSFAVAVSQDVSVGDVKQFLNELSQSYMDEVDDARFPDLDGVEDVVVDVIPPWED